MPVPAGKLLQLGLAGGLNFVCVQKHGLQAGGGPGAGLGQKLPVSEILITKLSVAPFTLAVARSLFEIPGFVMSTRVLPVLLF